MGMIYIMLIVSLVIAVFFLVTFFWATKSGQFDEDYAPSVRILFDDDKNLNANQNTNKNTKQELDGTTEV
ncbi:MAG: cbb3-type cytochrome oxidase assembly protein CcoS [Crocinitomicaceae bacterium]|nr:cbb3-type cytochrome oxidase assembly protein CcoS [Crocinitomicaceae bacterium]